MQMSSISHTLRFEKMLARAANRGRTSLEVIGTDSTLSLALYLSQFSPENFGLGTHLVVLANPKEVSLFEEHFRFFDSTTPVTILPSFDVSPFSGLYPGAQQISSRLHWLHRANKPEPRHIFVASIDALLQRTLPPTVLKAHSHEYRKGSDLPMELGRALERLGYQAAPIVEDVGTFSIRGGIVDIFSPAHENPVRVELFGDTIETLRFFDPDSQRSLAEADRFSVIPPREILYDDDIRMRAAAWYRNNITGRSVDSTDRDEVLQAIVQGHGFPGADFLIPGFYEEFCLPIDHLNARSVSIWLCNPIEVAREADLLIERLRSEREEAVSSAICPDVDELYAGFDRLDKYSSNLKVTFSKIQFQDHPLDEEKKDDSITVSTNEILNGPQGDTSMDAMLEKVHGWRDAGYSVFVAARTQSQAQRLLAFFSKSRFEVRQLKDNDYDLGFWCEEQERDRSLVHLVPRGLADSLRFNDERIVFLRDEDFFGKRQARKKAYKQAGTLEERTNSVSFKDLNPGDSVVHILHGVGIYEGLKVMEISGAPAEFITIAYKDNDKLYLPIYRINQIHKYSGPRNENLIDKLGGHQWQKTKIKVRNHLRELAADLLKLYAKRSQAHRAPFPNNDDDFAKFEGSFPYDETDDQLKAVGDIVGDMTSDRPMDRLVCGDVGFGKTEVAMRAAFKAVEGRKQVAVLAPTTVLSFQHLETFQKRFKNWPVKIRALNRFVSNADAKEVVTELREGKVDIVVGTHRVLSKDIVFKDLGLLIIDEEQRFGVTHKEKIRKMKSNVDTLTLSATPIPRTLNMSLVGMRDLSIINTPPSDRLPTRTFVTRYDKETIRKAITAEIQRGGQVFFLHNRVQSIYSVADEIRQIVPEARIRVGHGQMDENELEQVMVAFYHHQVDVLICTTIIEAGIDNPRANTMFIDNAHQFGLSQLYQLRGRVGRSKERAYCYLLIPANKKLEKDAQDRLKIIQENTALGSGIRIAHHDLELRGSGNILGEDQSGHIDSVGYEMYLELLEQALKEARGEELVDEIEPEINVRIPALIPDSYIPDIRIRLSYYKVLSEISAPEDLDRVEAELSDQFGALPEQVMNLMGLMLIRNDCRSLGIRDLSSGPKSISLVFTEKTPVPAPSIVTLASREPKKYSLTPDMRLNVRLDVISWPLIYDELQTLKKLVDGVGQTKVEQPGKTQNTSVIRR